MIVSVHGSVPTGKATWVYDVAGGQPAMWASAIAAFNKDAQKPIEIIYSYGGDMEYYPDDKNPFQTYFPLSSQQAAQTYSEIKGVTTVILVIDGRMDGGEDYSPDLSKLTAAQAKQWAAVTAELYCSFPQVGGLQIDLEPFKDPYKTNLIVFLSELSKQLQSKDANCVNDKYPNGRSLSTFLMAGAATSEVYQALGPNGFAIISGYDLSDTAPGTVNTPAQYNAALLASVKQTLANIGNGGGKFSLGVPAAASTHEFELYVTSSGKTVKGFPMWSNSTDSYLSEVNNVITQTQIRKFPGFLGVSLWGFSSAMAYPPHSNNLFYPSNPFVDAGEENWLKNNF